MTWNWQQHDWPAFSFDAARLRQAEERFLLASGCLAGAIRHLAPADHELLTVETMSHEALTTSEIEGEILDRSSVQSSIRRELGLAALDRSDRRLRRQAKPAEQGIASLMVDLYRNFAGRLTEDTLFAWHRLLMQGREDLRDIGRYRTGADAMQVVSGASYAPKIHFEAPPSTRVPREMARFVRWFNRTAPGGAESLPAITRAGLAHLYFESIHPFEDGNGRLGRAISEKALAQSAREPSPTALAATILLRRKEYYRQLEAANKSNQITIWLAWFAGLVLEAQQRAEARVLFLIDKSRLLDRLRGELNARQEKALIRMLRAGPEGFQGGLSAANYITITGASPATATRDLADLVDKEALVRRGQLRHTRYDLAISLRPVRPVRLDQNGEVVFSSR